MELGAAKNPKSATPVKGPSAENVNPNLARSSPAAKPTGSPAAKSAKSSKSQKSGSKNPAPVQNPAVFSPRKKIRERRFVVAKKNPRKENVVAQSSVVDCKCKERFGGNMKKCLCVAYENLRASQEEFFKIRDDDGKKIEEEEEEEEEMEKGLVAENDVGIEDGSGSDEIEGMGKVGSSTIKRRRARVLEEARKSVPECGKVKHLVHAFEKLLSIPSAKESDKKEGEEEEKAEEEGKKKKAAMQWALPGLVPDETQVSSSSLCPSDFIVTSESLGLDSKLSVSSSWDSSQGSVSRRTSNGGRRSRRNSFESCGTMGSRRWKKKKQLKPTCQKPFNLRTEQRGKMKEEEFMKKVQEIMVEEERQRIPIAQGLPWTTDEPECLIKPPVKENTRPVDPKLHSDIRAGERAEFDQQVSEKMNLIEQYKMERERQQKLAEEEEVRRLRKELVPKAQPMPYFDRPFIPRRSMKHPTVPREPKFHIPQHKKIKCCVSWNDMTSCTFQQ